MPYSNLMIRGPRGDSQIGYTASESSPYVIGDFDILFAVGQTIHVRFPTSLTRRAILNGAFLRVPLMVKDANRTQSSSHRIRAHASGDSDKLIPGYWEDRRPKTSAYVDFTASWTAGDSTKVVEVNIRSILEELKQRDDFKSGAYITISMECLSENGSDMGVRANTLFLEKFALGATYIDPSYPVQSQINELQNSSLHPSVEGMDGPNVPAYWYQSDYFGSHVEPSVSGGVIAVDQNFVRKPGVPSLRFTAGSPDSNVMKKTGITSWIDMNQNTNYIFCGWIYVPTYIPLNADMVATHGYIGPTEHYISERGVWTPFCTIPYKMPAELDRYWCNVSMRRFQPGWQFWISEPAMIASDFRQLPFSGNTSDKFPIKHRFTSAQQMSVREWIPRTTAFQENGSPMKSPTYSMREDGILQLLEPVKGGPKITQLPSVPISDLSPARERIVEC